MTSLQTSPLISTADLAARLGQPGLKVVDASWHLDARNGRTEFDQIRIPGAVFFDLDAVSDPSSGLPHMLPSPEPFAEAAGALGLSETDTIVVYDAQGLFSAARVWWTFWIMGAADVRVLDGGLPAWRAEGRPVEHGSPIAPTPARFEASFDAGAVASLADVRAALTGEAQVLDARPMARFRAEAAEPRPGVRAGHMPGAVSLPFKSVLTEAGLLKRGETLAAAFEDAGVDLNQPLVTTCGSGVTAAILTLALTELGRGSRLYDGSWVEWGGREDTPVLTGP